MIVSRRLNWLCNSPSPYNAQLFCALAAEPDVDLLVHYRRNGAFTHPWRSNLVEGYASRTYAETLGVDWHLIRLALAPPKRFSSEAFVIAGWNNLTAWLSLAVLAIRRGNFAIWSDTPNAARNRSGWLQQARRIFLVWVFGRARYVMGTGTPALKVLEQMGAPRSKLVDFPCWIDVGLYDGSRQRSTQSGGNLVFLSCGRLQNDLKGHDLALRALALADGDGIGGFEYRIAGSGPDDMTLRHLAEELGLHDRVKLLGWLDPADVIEEMKTADVLIHPSPVHEPYGVAVIEAMAAGMVVLASDATCGALDRIEPGVNGFIHPAGDFRGLAAQIRGLLAGREIIARVGAAARKTAEQWPMSKGVGLVKQIVNGPLRS